MCTLKRPLTFRILPRPHKILKTANLSTTKQGRRRDIWDIECDDDDDELPPQFELVSECDSSIATASAPDLSPLSFDHNFSHDQTESRWLSRRKLTVVEDEEEERETLVSGEQELDVLSIAAELVHEWSKDLAPFDLDPRRFRDSSYMAGAYSQPTYAGERFKARPPGQPPTDTQIATVLQQEDKTSEANIAGTDEASQRIPAVPDEDPVAHSAASVVAPIPFPPGPPLADLGEDEDTIVVAVPPIPTTPPLADLDEDEDTIVVYVPPTPTSQQRLPSRRKAKSSQDFPAPKATGGPLARTPKRRGRPAKAAAASHKPIKVARGRPKKVDATQMAAAPTPTSAKRQRDNEEPQVPVKKKISNTAYALRLPPKHGRIHSTFHVSLLQKYEQRPGCEPPEPIDVDGEEEHEVEEILSSRGSGRNKKWLVRWKGWSEAYDTWEPIEHLENATEMIHEYEEQRT